MNILLVPCALICGVFLVYEISQALKSHQAKKWKRCVGELVKWDINEIVNLGSSLENFCYRYSFSGKEYESRNVGFGFSLSIGYSFGLFRSADKAFD